jgi:spore coat polysaccharide biosynthesis protein SpsF
MTYRNDLLIILTARMSSERLHGKVVAPIAGKPLLQWIIERLHPLAEIVVATPADTGQYPIWDITRRMNVPLLTHPDEEDVLTRMDCAVQRFKPDASFVLRALGDCPFMGDLQGYMTGKLAENGKDILVYALAPYAANSVVYGSRESPISRTMMDRISRESKIRAHPDAYFHEHRELFNVLYHEAPPNIYLRGNYRLEVDYPTDVELVRNIGEHVGMLAPMPEIIKYLDEHPDVVRLNRENVERTGLTCYDYRTQRAWTKDMVGKDIHCWDGNIWRAPDDKSQPIFCKSGMDFLGYANRDGILQAKFGRIASGYLNCACGSGLLWHQRTIK